jgi:hypothetical protein
MTPPPPPDNPLPEGHCTCRPNERETCEHCRQMAEWCRREAELAGQKRLPWEEEEPPQEGQPKP